MTNQPQFQDNPEADRAFADAIKQQAQAQSEDPPAEKTSDNENLTEAPEVTNEVADNPNEKKQINNLEGPEPLYEDPVKNEAAQYGWVDKDEWNGPPEDWTNAKSFLRVRELGQDLHETRKLLRQQQAEADRNLKTNEILYSQQIKELQEKIDRAEILRKERIEDGDTEKVLGIEAVIDEYNKDMKELQQAAPVTNTPLDGGSIIINNWLNENPWLKEEGPQGPYALHLFNEGIKKIPADAKGKAADKYLIHLLNDINATLARQFPERQQNQTVPRKQTNPNRKKGAATTKGAKTTSKGRSLTIADFTRQETNFINEMRNMGLYKDDADAIKAVENARREVNG